MVTFISHYIGIYKEKTFAVYKIVRSSPVIELHSDLIIQDKSWYFMTVFGDSKRILLSRKASNFLDSARF